MLEKYFGKEKTKWPNTLIDMEVKIEDNDIAFATMGMAISYLENSLLDEKVIKLSDYLHIG